MRSTWYFDFISPFAYLHLKEFSRLPRRLEVDFVPVLFAGLLGHWGQLGPAEIPEKRLQTYRYCHWRASRIGARFRMPPAHPFVPLRPLRLCLAAGPSHAVVEAIFDYVWGEGLDVDDRDAFVRLGRRVGVDDVDAACSDERVKASLRRNTSEAVARGVYGVPTFDLDGELFWGADSLDLMLDYLDDPNLFDDAEMKRIAQLPAAAERPRSSDP